MTTHTLSRLMHRAAYPTAITACIILGLYIGVTWPDMPWGRLHEVMK